MNGFLAATTSPAAEELAAADRAGLGYVMNLSRVWAYQPAGLQALAALLGQVAEAGTLPSGEQGVLAFVHWVR